MKHCATSCTGEATPNTPRVEVLTQYCKGCGLCMTVCPNKAIVLSDEVSEDGMRVAVVSEGVACLGCGRCYLMCPDAAIVVELGKAWAEEVCDTGKQPVVLTG